MGFALKQKGVPKAERIIQVRARRRFILDLGRTSTASRSTCQVGSARRCAMGRAIVTIRRCT